jgi:hypothetical protein
MKVIRQHWKNNIETFIVRGFDRQIQDFFYKEYPNKEINILRNPKDKSLYEVIVKERDTI